MELLDLRNPILSTQEIIENARARRQQKSNQFSCEQCGYKSTSKTLFNNHIKTYHKENGEDIDTKTTQPNLLSIRKRFTCENCEFKSTNENLLEMHINTNHKREVNISKSKRLHCNMCDKKFNKQETSVYIKNIVNYQDK